MQRKSKRKTLKAIALSFATAAVFTGTAAGNQPEIPYLSHGQGVDESSFSDGGRVFESRLPYGYVGLGIETTPGGITPTDLARAVPREPDGGVTPTNLARSVPQSPPVAVAATSDGYDRDDVAIGFGLGLILATACAAALLASRDRMRMAQA